MNDGNRRSTVRTGALAEAVGRRFLEGQGLRLLEQNYRCRCGEIDLVMRDGADLVMVEVRYRARAGWIDPAATVTSAKRRRLLRAAARYLQGTPGAADRTVRFDVLSLSGPLAAPRYDWIRGAFTTDDA